MHDRHEEWLPAINAIPIITIDTGVYDIYRKDHQLEIAQKINEFIEKINRMGRGDSPGEVKYVTVKEEKVTA